MAWYYAEGGQQKGPVDDAALDELVRQGKVKDDTLVWREGMATWQPHAAVRGGTVATAPPPASGAPAETRYCSECGRPFAASELTMVGTAAVCSACRPIVMQRMPGAASGSFAPPGSAPGGAPPPGYPPPSYQAPGYAAPGYAAPAGWHYGGFWARFIARVIDWIILGIVGTIIRIPLALAFGLGGAGLRIANDPGAAIAALPIILGAASLGFTIQIAIGVAYEAYFVSTRGATPGKMALGLKIVRAADGALLTPIQAVGRYFAMWLSAIIFMIGYVMAGFDPEKRSLHDRICETRVIYAR